MLSADLLAERLGQLIDENDGGEPPLLILLVPEAVEYNGHDESYAVCWRQVLGNLQHLLKDLRQQLLLELLVHTLWLEDFSIDFFGNHLYCLVSAYFQFITVSHITLALLTVLTTITSLDDNLPALFA